MKGDEKSQHRHDDVASRGQTASQKILAELRLWLEQTTIHGVPRIYRTRSLLLRIFWLACFTLCASYLLYALVKTLIDYAECDVTTNISQQRAPSIPFPTITVCNKYPFKVNANPAVAAIIQASYSNLSAQSTPKSLYNVDKQLEYLTRSSLLNRNFSHSDRLKFFLTLDEMLIQCVYNNHECYPTTDFERHEYSYRYGFCYKFNSGYTSQGLSDDSGEASGRVGPQGKIKTTSSPGRFNGLRLELFLGHPDDSFGFEKSRGLFLFVHNSTIDPAIGAEGISLEIGEETNVIIDQINYKKLPSPYSSCIMDVRSMSSFNSDMYRQTIRSMRIYSQKSCLLICFNNYLYSRCHCWDITQASIYFFLLILKLFYISLKFERQDKSKTLFLTDELKCIRNSSKSEFILKKVLKLSLFYEFKSDFD
jgi:hypothetical protein